MRVDCVITAGEGRAAKKVFGRNKTLLEVDGKPILRHIVEVLRACEAIGEIVVVGSTADFTPVIGDLPVKIVEQKRNLMENGWEGFLQTIPEYRRTGVLTEAIVRDYRDKPILGVPGDVPLITVAEVSEFIGRCDMERFDYCAGITAEEILNAFGPRKGMPGIKMATFHTRDGNFRQNNLHVARPFVLFSSIDLVLKAYEYRYQRKLGNILRALLEIVRLGPGRVGTTLMVYIDLQIAAGLSALGLERAARVVSWPLTRRSIERVVSSLIKARFRLVETTVGGAALDVDNERDYMTLSVMYRDWMNLIRQRAHQRAK